jgi:hypothetical protein
LPDTSSSRQAFDPEEMRMEVVVLPVWCSQSKREEKGTDTKMLKEKKEREGT